MVSEWMGFHLLHEAMLDSVLFARAKWLRPGGRMLPCTARVFAAPVCMDAFCADKFGFWSDVRGFDMSALAPLAAAAALSEPAVTDVAPEQLLAAPALVASIDCATARVADLYADLGGRLAFPCTDFDPRCGRYLFYRDVRRHADGRGLLCTVAGERVPLHGGIIAENWTQGTARDVFASAWLRCVAAGYRPVLTVHDEFLFELREETAREDLRKIREIMERPVPWAPGLPLAAPGKLMSRYGK